MVLTLSRRILVLVVTILMALTMVAGPVASGADAKAHKDNLTQHPTLHPTTQNHSFLCRGAEVRSPAYIRL